MIYNYFTAKRNNYQAEANPTKRRIACNIEKTLLILLLPSIIMGGT
jgi:TRAP-type C4-dicarboxylate transport system permease large subunit